MEYKGVEYTVVQTCAPTGWKWTVSAPAGLRSTTGMSHSREEATRIAQIRIDRAIKQAKPADQ